MTLLKQNNEICLKQKFSVSKCETNTLFSEIVASWFPKLAAACVNSSMFTDFQVLLNKGKMPVDIKHQADSNITRWDICRIVFLWNLKYTGCTSITSKFRNSYLNSVSTDSPSFDPPWQIIAFEGQFEIAVSLNMHTL
jgi:hypothetical protein